MRQTRVSAAVVIIVTTWCGAVRAADLPVDAAPPRLDRAPDTTIDLHGRVREYVDAVTKNWLLRAPDDNPAMLDMFADRDHQPYRNLLPWSGEFAGKYLTAGTQVLRVTGDPTLKAYLQKFVDKLVTLQDDDGYLGPFPKDSRLTGKAPNVNGTGGDTWDAWGHYHVMLGLLLWHDTAGDDTKALAAAKKIGDLLCAKFLGTGTTITSTGSAEMNLAVAHSLTLLYRHTGEQKYLDLSRQVVNEFAQPGAGDYRNLALSGKEFFQGPKPRWESLHPILALAELNHLTGDADDRLAFERLWWSIAKLDRHNNGGFSSGEQAQGNPYHPGAIETCCTIAWMAMSVEMLRTTGNSIVADELELSTLNQVVALHDPSGAWCTYNTPMDGVRKPSGVDIAFQKRPGSEELSCCSVNAARGFGMISDWALMTERAAKEGEPAALVLNWYGPGKLTTSLPPPSSGTPGEGRGGGQRVELVQETDYPRDGTVNVTVNPSKPSRFALKLRIPHWSSNTSVNLNGQPVKEVDPGTFCTIDREWRAGDRVSITLAFAPHLWVGERECAGKASLYRGPLLLAYSIPDGAPDGGAMPRVDFKALNKFTDPIGEVSPGTPWLQVNVPAEDGKPVRLIDYASAGMHGTRYVTWLPVLNAKPAEFSTSNPTRRVGVHDLDKKD